MEDLPPRGSTRRRVALAIFTVLTLSGAAVIAHGIYLWAFMGRSGPILVGLSGLVFLVYMWRWVIERL